MKLLIMFIGLQISFVNYSQNGFQTNIVTDNKNVPNSPRSVFAADLDGDGDMDLLSASYEDHKIAWFENIDGYGNFGEQQIITTNAILATSVYAADIDSDNDVDVLSASSNKIAWYENDGQGSFGLQQIISTNVDHAKSIIANDIDNDGDIDVLSASYEDNKIAWYENIDGMGTFGNQMIITTNAEGATSIYSTDIDNDGDIDVLSSSSSDNKIAWYENIDGQGNFGIQQIISSDTFFASFVYSTDLDNDGDMDVLAASTWGFDEKIIWFENLNGLGTFASEQLITNNVDDAISIYASDLDNDNDMDILSASFQNDKIAWYENLDGQGTFGTQQIITTNADGAKSVYACDLDADNYIDVIFASSLDNKIAWYKNSSSNGTFEEKQIITINANGAIDVFSADIDNDGDLDILSASYLDDKIAWYENIDSYGTFGDIQIISTNAHDVFSVFAIDIDNDNNIDVLSASRSDDKIAWYKNMDGLGNFSEERVITNIADGAYSVFAIDIDNDGFIDVISASAYDNKIAWYKNIDGLGNFSSQQIISTNADHAFSVYAIDIDNDDDIDVLSASGGSDSKIAWYENTNGLGLFGDQRIISTNCSGAYSVYAVDIDNDGDIDVISASSGDDKIAWYENIDGQGVFGLQQIISTNADYAKSIIADDLDNDGDIDVISASAWDDKVAWYENIDGQGNFGLQQIISTNADFASSVHVCDINNDSHLDILSASFHDDKIAWHENLGVLTVHESILYNYILYPNPSDLFIKIISKTKVVDIKVYNNIGQVVSSESNNSKIDISFLKQGIYFLKVKDENGNLRIKKIIKK